MGVIRTLFPRFQGAKLRVVFNILCTVVIWSKLEMEKAQRKDKYVRMDGVSCSVEIVICNMNHYV